MRISLLEGSVTQIFLNWTTGSVLVGYMVYLHSSPIDLALISSVPLLAQMVSPLAGWWAGLLGRRKGLTALTAVIGRGVWVLAATLPQLGIPPHLEPAFMVLLVLVSSLFQSLTGVLWTSWMGDVVPGEQRGRYFGFRTGWTNLVGMLGNLAAGKYLDHHVAPMSFQVLLWISVGIAAVGIGLYFLHYEPPVRTGPTSLAKNLSVPLADPDFRVFLRFAVFWQLAVMTGSPFVYPYFLTQLKLSYEDIAIWSAISASWGLLVTWLWGRVADRFGNKAVLAIGSFLAGTALPLSWVLAGLSGNIGWIWVAGVLDSTCWGAINPAIFNLALVNSPREDRMAYVGVYSLTSGLAGFLGGLISGPLLSVLLRAHLTLLGIPWTGYYSLFAISGLLRSQAWRLLRPVKETHAWRTRDVLRELRPWKFLGMPWRGS
jgi:MFS family permease